MTVRQSPWVRMHEPVRAAITPALLAEVRACPDWRRVAFHEAGHAVAAVALGVRLDGLALLPGRADRLAGMCWTDPRGLSPERAVMASLIVSFAGAAGGRLADPTAAPSPLDQRAAVAAATAAARGHAPGAGPAAHRRLLELALARGRAAADRLVAAQAAAVRRAADALLASDRLALAGAEVRALVNGHGQAAAS